MVLTQRRRSAGGSFLCLLVALVLVTGGPAGLSAEGGPSQAAQRLSAVDLDGRLHRPGDDSECRAVAVVFLSTGCPISNGSVPALNRLFMAHRRGGLEFFGVISDAATTRSEAVRHSKEYQVRFPVLFDCSGELRDRLKPTHAPQAFVLSPQEDVLYSGCIDDLYAAAGRRKLQASRHYLEEAIQATLAGKPVPVPRTEPVGCLLDEPADRTAPGAVTFNRDIAPIMHQHCASCHRPGEAAPFSLLTYEDVSRRAAQIREATATRFMPPWKAEPGFGHFKDERRLSDRQIALIAAWAEAGRPEGDPADLPSPPTFAQGWQLGKPDLVLRVPRFQVSADTIDRHQHFVLPTGLRENRMISAIEFRPGNPQVVHHASFYLDTTGQARKMAASPAAGYTTEGGPGFVPSATLRSWLPGFTPRNLPAGSGRLIPRRSDLVVGIHYHGTGRDETDQSMVGLYFAPRGSRQPVGELQVLNLNLDIPAGAVRHRHLASYTLPAAVTLLDVAPHMHVLGREVTATATLPDGRVEPLVRVTDWDFNWQEQYLYANPLRLPRGTRIDVEFIYDNSADNPLNPHSPPQPVRWGQGARDEMNICHFHYTCESMQDFMTVDGHYQAWLAGQHTLTADGSGAR